MSSLDDRIDAILEDDDVSVFALEDTGTMGTSAAIMTYGSGDETMFVRFGRGYAGLHVEVCAYRHGEPVAVDSIGGFDGVIVQPKT